MNGEYSVYQWGPDGKQSTVLANVDAKTAGTCAFSLAMSAWSCISHVKRVIVTDAGDCTVYEWLEDEGVIFP